MVEVYRRLACRAGKSLSEAGKCKLSLLPHSPKQFLQAGVISEGLADVGKQVPIPGCKDKASPKLKRIWAQLVLAISGGAGALASRHVGATQKVEKGGTAQARHTVGLPLLVNEQGKCDARLLAEQPGIIQVAQSDGGQARTVLMELPLVSAQLRDVLAAEDSTVVPKEGDHRGTIGPERAEPHLVALSVGQDDGGKTRTEGGAEHRRIVKPLRNSALFDQRPASIFCAGPGP